MKKVKINKDLCIGCGSCIAEAQNSMEFDSDGKANCIAEMDDNIAESIKNNCPVNAIEIG
ncbi:MAG: ferredoxin [Bacilli bacterium]|nr:ferredoxin [Bacilli bacterium]